MKYIIALLKKLKHIEADSSYTRDSRRVILSVPGDARETPLTAWRILANSFHIGSTIVLTGLLIILVLGGFSAGKFLTPFRLSSLDVDSLQAEAEAIDIQIQLTDFEYQEAERAPQPSEKTDGSVTGEKTELPENPEAGKEIPASEIQSSGTVVSIDQVFERLSQ